MLYTFLHSRCCTPSCSKKIIIQSSMFVHSSSTLVEIAWKLYMLHENIRDIFFLQNMEKSGCLQEAFCRITMELSEFELKLKGIKRFCERRLGDYESSDVWVTKMSPKRLFIDTFDSRGITNLEIIMSIKRVSLISPFPLVPAAPWSRLGSHHAKRGRTGAII